MITLAYLLYSVVCFVLGWLCADALRVRFEFKTSLKVVGAVCLGLAALCPAFFSEESLSPLLFIFISSIAFYAFYLAFIFDEHSKFGFGIVIMIAATVFFRSTLLLALQAGLVSLVILQLAYTTQHRDFIPLGIGFVLIAVAEFLKSQGEEFLLSGALVYIFVSVFFGIWLWQYIGPRFRLKKKVRLTHSNGSTLTPPPHLA